MSTRPSGRLISTTSAHDPSPSAPISTSLKTQATYPPSVRERARNTRPPSHPQSRDGPHLQRCWCYRGSIVCRDLPKRAALCTRIASPVLGHQSDGYSAHPGGTAGRSTGDNVNRLQLACSLCPPENHSHPDQADYQYCEPTRLGYRRHPKLHSGRKEIKNCAAVDRCTLRADRRKFESCRGKLARGKLEEEAGAWNAVGARIVPVKGVEEDVQDGEVDRIQHPMNRGNIGLGNRAERE